MEIDKALAYFSNFQHQAGVIVLVELIHFAATSWPTTSWGIVKCERYYSKGLHWDEIIPPGVLSPTSSRELLHPLGQESLAVSRTVM